MNLSRLLSIFFLFAETLLSWLQARRSQSYEQGLTLLNSKKDLSILLFGYMGLGDALMLEPALLALLKKYPDASIDLVVSRHSPSRQILERILHSQHRHFRNVDEASYKALSLVERRALNRKLASRKYDVVIASYMTPTPYYIEAILSAPIRLGHRIPSSKWYKPRPNWLFNFAVDLYQDTEHEMQRQFRLYQQLSVEDEPFIARLELTDSEKQAADAFWNEHDLASKLVVGTHFGASKEQHWKKYSDEKFSEVLYALRLKYDAVFLHFGVESELQQIEAASSKVIEHSIILAGKLNVFEVAALLQRCDMMIGNDSGIGHVAMAVGTQSIRVFGMSDYYGYRSLSSTNVDVFKGVECSPCLQLGMLKPYNVHNCGHKKCMGLITADEVVSAVLALRQP